MPSLHEQLMANHGSPVLRQQLGRPGVKYRIAAAGTTYTEVTITAMIGPIGGRQISDDTGVKQVLGGDAEVFTDEVPAPSTRDKISPDGGTTWFNVNEVFVPSGGKCGLSFIRERTQEISQNARGKR